MLVIQTARGMIFTIRRFHSTRDKKLASLDTVKRAPAQYLWLIRIKRTFETRPLEITGKIAKGDLTTSDFPSFEKPLLVGVREVSKRGEI